MMQIPMRTFWLMNSCIERIQAQQDKRFARVSLSAGMNASNDSVKELFTSLDTETGTVVKTVFDPIKSAVRDEAGFNDLKEMAGQKITT